MAWCAYGCLLTMSLLLLAACSSEPNQASPAAGAHDGRLVDLSHVVRADVPHPPGEPATRLYHDQAGALTHVTLGTQTGSLVQMVAVPGSDPAHLEALSPRDLVLPAVVLDMRDQAQDQPGFELLPSAILAWERDHGRVPAGALVLLVTGWDVRWGAAADYLDDPPRFSQAALELLVDQRGVAALGIDGPALTFMPKTGFTLLLKNLTSLEQLPPTGATVVIGALRLQAATHAPARVIALVP